LKLERHPKNGVNSHELHGKRSNKNLGFIGSSACPGSTEGKLIEGKKEGKLIV
jgi:hypothetical protein